MGSSRDWAAKGTMLLGIKAVVVESFERIHRSNLVGMGVLPLTFKDGVDPAHAGPDGRRDHRHRGPGDHHAAHGPDHAHPPRRRHDGRGAADVPRRYRSTRSNTTATAASCSTCCAGWRRPPEKQGQGPCPWTPPRAGRPFDPLLRVSRSRGAPPGGVQGQRPWPSFSGRPAHAPRVPSPSRRRPRPPADRLRPARPRHLRGRARRAGLRDRHHRQRVDRLAAPRLHGAGREPRRASATWAARSATASPAC